jgi:hypothetical protein
MPKGPLGGPRPLTKDKRTVLVLVGIDGPAPPKDLRVNLQETVNTRVNERFINAGANIKATRQTVNLTLSENPTTEQRSALGARTIHVQQFGIKTGMSEVSQGLVNALHNIVVEKVTELGFNIVGTKTTIG